MKRASVTIGWQPAYWATVIAVAMMLAGFGLLLLGWRGAAALVLVPLQLPYGASGGLTGLALIGFGAALLNVQVARRLGARERVHIGQAAREATGVLMLARSTDPSVED